jgi:hypothetical protein
MPPKAPASKRAKKDQLYCVVSSLDGPIIMTVEDANVALSNLPEERRHVTRMHFAGALERAKVMQEKMKEQPLSRFGE